MCSKFSFPYSDFTIYGATWWFKKVLCFYEKHSQHPFFFFSRMTLLKQRDAHLPLFHAMLFDIIYSTNTQWIRDLIQTLSSLFMVEWQMKYVPESLKRITPVGHSGESNNNIKIGMWLLSYVIS